MNIQAMTGNKYLSWTIKYLRMSAVGILFLLILAILAFYIFLFTYDVDSQRANIEGYLSNLLDRKVVIEGGLKLRPDFGSPALVARNIKIANPEWSDRPWFVEAKNLKGSISLIDLLSSELVINKISLSSAKIIFEKNPEGKPNWPTGKPGNSSGGKLVIPSILNLKIEDLELLVLTEGRPAINIAVNSIDASLVHGKPIGVSAHVSYRDVPVKIDLTGDTLESLIKAELNWPLAGKIKFPSMDVNVDGKILRDSNLVGINLHLSDVEQKPIDKDILGWRNDGIGLLDVKFNLKKVNKRFDVSLAADVRQVAVTHLAKKNNFKPNLNAGIGALNIHYSGYGENVNDIIKNSTSSYELKNADFTFNPDNKQKEKQLYIESMDTLIAPGKPIKTLLTGKYLDNKFVADIEHGRMIDLIWSNEPWPYTAKIDVFDGQLTTSGNIANHAVLGRFDIAGKSTKKTLSHFTSKPVEWGKFHLTGEYDYKQNILKLNKLGMKLADSILKGNAQVLASDIPELTFSVESEKMSFGKLLHPFKALRQYDVNAKKINLSGKTQGKTLTAWRDHLDLEFASPGLMVKKSSSHLVDFKNIEIISVGSGSLTATGAASTLGTQFNLALQSSPIQSIFTAESIPIVVNMSNDSDFLKLDAKVTGLKPDSKDKPVLMGMVQAKIDNLSKITEPGNLKLPAYKNLTFMSQAYIQNKELSLRNLSVHSENTEINGGMAYGFDKNKLAVQIKDSQFDLAQLFAAYGPGKLNLDESDDESGPVQNESAQENTITRKNAVAATIIPHEELNIELLKKLNLDLDINKLRLTYKNEPVNQFNLKLGVENGALELYYSGASSTGSDSEMELNIYANAKPPRVEMNIDINKLNYGEIFKTLDLTNAVSGAVNIDVNLVADGYNTQELLNTAKGNIVFVSDTGRVPRRLLELWGAGFFRILLPTTWVEEDTTQLHCAVGRFEVTDGYLKSQTLLADTERVTVAGELAVRLEDETIKGLITTKSKSATLIKLATPIAVSGTVRNPVTSNAENKLVTIGKWILGLSDPYAMILLFGDLGSEVKNPCAALLKITEKNDEQNGSVFE